MAGETGFLFAFVLLFGYEGGEGVAELLAHPGLLDLVAVFDAR